MVYVTRDEDGKIVGKFVREQFEGQEFLEENSAELMPSIDSLKADKNAEINAARLQATFTTFTHLNKTFACDQLSRSDIDAINGYVGTRNAMPPNWVGGWKAVDNSLVAIGDVAAWNAFYDSMIIQGQTNFAKSQTLKAQLAAATTKTQVDAIAW